MRYEQYQGEYLRVIETARTLETINHAAHRGLFPLVKEVQYDPSYFRKLLICQDPETGIIALQGDYRSEKTADYSPVTSWIKAYDYPSSPFAAYLIPKDLKTGERVFIIDLIENIEGGTWNQGDRWRLESSPATWNGEDFDIDEVATHFTIG